MAPRVEAALFGDDLAAISAADSIDTLLAASSHPSSTHGARLPRTSIIEVRTLLSGYLLSSQGDRMLMANSVEGRFPFLDRRVVALAESLPAAYKLRVLDEKHVLKARGTGTGAPSADSRSHETTLSRS